MTEHQKRYVGVIVFIFYFIFISFLFFKKMLQSVTNVSICQMLQVFTYSNNTLIDDAVDIEIVFALSLLKALLV